MLQDTRALFLQGEFMMPGRTHVTVNVLDPLDNKGRSLANTFAYDQLVEPYLTLDNEFTNFIVANFGDCE